MEDLITIIIVIAAVIFKLRGVIKRDPAAPPAEKVDPKELLQELFGDGSTVEDTPVPEAAAPRMRKTAAPAQVHPAAESAAAARDAALLEAQKRYAAMAEQAEARNRSSLAEERSAIYQTAGEVNDVENEPGKSVDWAEFIRNNPTGALIASEILAPPAALR